MKPDLKFDKRIAERHVALGIMPQAELDAFMAALPDVSDRAAELSVQIGDVGVTDVLRKDTGETDD
ncbi:MAG: hypothetical protein ACI9U2_004828 [Bradymonadia bacterium]|jgi:hypothetical protein